MPEKVVNPCITCYGYANVALYSKGNFETQGVHRVVARTFLENPNNLPVVNHKDENPLNNNVDNLEWCSYAYNTRYSLDRIQEKPNEFNKILDLLADSQKVSLRDMAEKSGLKYASLKQRYLHRSVSLHQMCKIADAYEQNIVLSFVPQNGGVPIKVVPRIKQISKFEYELFLEDAPA